MSFEWPEHMQLQSKYRVASILWALQRVDGEIAESSGLVTSLLNDICREQRVRVLPKSSPGTYAGLIANMTGEREGSPWATSPLLERELNGKRTYALRLLIEDADLPDPRLAWSPAFMPVDVAQTYGILGGQDVETETEPETEVEVEPETEPETVDVGPVSVEEGDVENLVEAVESISTVPVVPIPSDPPSETPEGLRKLLAINRLATDLMVEFAAMSRPAENDLVARLVQANEEITSYRAKVQTLEAALSSKVSEVHALRQSLKLTGANAERLREALASTNGHVVDEDRERQRRLLQGIMVETPRSGS